jgi:hypothetical protein
MAAMAAGAIQKGSISFGEEKAEKKLLDDKPEIFPSSVLSTIDRE